MAPGSSILSNDEWRKNADHYKRKLQQFVDEVRLQDPAVKVTGAYVRENCIDLQTFSAKQLNNKLSQLRTRENSALELYQSIEILFV